jgi:2-polyprenyl-6-methoxyphenol hydroxylase-like FAD-dependent oxidoreductase
VLTATVDGIGYLEVTPTTDTTYITRIIPGDTVLVPVAVRIPYPIYIDSGSTVHHYYTVDTAAIIADYFRIRYYADTIFQDGNFRAVIKDSINYNRIVARAFEFQNLKPTTIYTTQLTHSDLNKPAWMLGADGIFDSQRIYLGPSVMYRSRDYHHFKLGICFAYDAQPAISLGYYKQINIKK